MGPKHRDTNALTRSHLARGSHHHEQAEGAAQRTKAAIARKLGLMLTAQWDQRVSKYESHPATAANAIRCFGVLESNAVFSHGTKDLRELAL